MYIHRYTRAQAIEDGVLIDVTSTAKEAGIRYPVALTRAVWERCVAIPPGVACQDEAGRLWDVVWLLRWSILRSDVCVGCGGRRPGHPYPSDPETWLCNPCLAKALDAARPVEATSGIS